MGKTTLQRWADIVLKQGYEDLTSKKVGEGRPTKYPMVNPKKRATDRT